MLAARPGTTILLTLTAPGSARHCWEHTYSDADGRIRPSVRCGIAEAVGSVRHDECPCSFKRLATDESIAHWNASIGRRWNDFVTELRRSVPGFKGAQFFRALETQRRGALHIHAVFRISNAALLTPEARVRIMHLAMRHGFGHEVDVRKIGEGSLDAATAARYIAKYVSKGSEVSPLMPQDRDCDCLPWDADPERVDDYTSDDAPLTSPCSHPKKPRRFLLRLWTTSRNWGLSLRTLRIQQGMYRLDPDAARSWLTQHLSSFGLRRLSEPIPPE